MQLSAPNITTTYGQYDPNARCITYGRVREQMTRGDDKYLRSTDANAKRLDDAMREVYESGGE